MPGGKAAVLPRCVNRPVLLERLHASSAPQRWRSGRSRDCRRRTLPGYSYLRSAARSRLSYHLHGRQAFVEASAPDPAAAGFLRYWCLPLLDHTDVDVTGRIWPVMAGVLCLGNCL